MKYAIMRDRPLYGWRVGFNIQSQLLVLCEQNEPNYGSTPFRRKQKELINRLLETMAKDVVPERPGRREPRAVKRRPKPFPNLNQPRHKFKDVAHPNRNWKNKTKKIWA